MHSQSVIKSALERSVQVVTLKPARGQRTYSSIVFRNPQSIETALTIEAPVAA